MALKVSFLSFVAGIGRKSIRFTKEGKSKHQKSKGQRAEGETRQQEDH